MLDEASHDHVDAEQASLTTATPPTVQDDLPRPPSGRRSQTRPAGPPAEIPPAPEAPVEPEPLPDEESTDDAVEPGDTPAEADVPQDVGPADEQPRDAEPEPLPGLPTSHESDAPATSAGSGGPRNDKASKADTTTEPRAGAEVDDALAQALEAVEASASRRSRRGTEGSGGDEPGEQGAPEGTGGVDTERALADLAAVIAGRNDQASTDEDVIADAEQTVADSEASSEAPTADEESAAGDQVEPAAQADGTDAAADAEQGDDDAEQGDDQNSGEESEEQTSTPRRRRRRGGRRRRRGGSGGGSDSDDSDESGEQTDTQSDEDSDSGDDSNGDEEAESNGEGSGTSASARRRRRRRRRGGDDNGDDDAEVAVRVREPRAKAVSDEISGIEGSTRLEAKKQRRREGRAAGRHRAPILTEAEFLARRESVDRIMMVRQRADYTQLAVLEDGVLVEHYVDRSSSTSLIGNIYLGRVQNVLPSMEAVFIDIGRGRNAVLYAGEVDWDGYDVSADSRKVEQVFKSGQAVLVQVSKDPVGAKGARLTGHISLPGRYVVYSPGGHLSGISRKLPDSERQRLKQILDQVVAEESSVIVRTAAEGASSDELIRDVERLKSQWEVIERKAKQGGAPQQLYAEPDLTLRIIRDTFTPDFKQLIVSGNGGPHDAFEAVSDYLGHVAPQLAERLSKWDESEGDLFAKHRIDEQIAKALERKVFLPSGGSLVIDRTEAMTVIDVNTGKFTGSGGNLEQTVTRNNLEAAEEIVRQLRLRDLGGIIVIDFIDMVLPSNRELLLRRLVECLGRDRTRHQVSEVTSLGLVQMTRKRIGTGLAEAFTDVCEHCSGRGYLRHDEPVDSQAPADGGERRGGKGGGGGSRGGGRAKSTGRNRNKSEEQAPKANQVQPSDAAREAAARLAAAASRQHAAEQEPDRSASPEEQGGRTDQPATTEGPVAGAGEE